MLHVFVVSNPYHGTEDAFLKNLFDKGIDIDAVRNVVRSQ